MTCPHSPVNDLVQFTHLLQHARPAPRRPGRVRSAIAAHAAGRTSADVLCCMTFIPVNSSRHTQSPLRETFSASLTAPFVFR